MNLPHDSLREYLSQFLLEFKQFVSRGNVIDLTIGVIIGSAFGKIISSLVSDIAMPLLGILLGGVNFTSLKASVHPPSRDAVVVAYGQFLQSSFDFLVIAFAVFVFVKIIQGLRENAKAPEKTPEEIELLREIRDLLKSSK